MAELTLLPCPFCGQHLLYDYDDNYREVDSCKWGAVVCGCGAQGPDVRTGYKDSTHWRDAAIQEWNKRALAPRLTRQQVDRAILNGWCLATPEEPPCKAFAYIADEILKLPGASE